jgi:hypothetical protein
MTGALTEDIRQRLAEPVKQALPGAKELARQKGLFLDV